MTPLTVTWKNSENWDDLGTPYAMCDIPNFGLFIVNLKGICLLNSTLKTKKCLGWGSPGGHYEHLYRHACVFLPSDNSVLVMRKAPDEISNSEFMQISIPSLSAKFRLFNKAPYDRAEIAPHLRNCTLFSFGYLPDKRLALVTSQTDGVHVYATDCAETQQLFKKLVLIGFCSLTNETVTQFVFDEQHIYCVGSRHVGQFSIDWRGAASLINSVAIEKAYVGYCVVCYNSTPYWFDSQAADADGAPLLARSGRVIPNDVAEGPSTDLVAVEKGDKKIYKLVRHPGGHLKVSVGSFDDYV